MFDVILVSHGNYAEALLETAKLIAGENVSAKTFSLKLDDSVDAFGEQVKNAIRNSLKTCDVLVLTDIQSGSPFNVTVGAASEFQFCHITGMNLPIVIEALSTREYMNLDEAFDDILSIGVNSILDVNQFLESLGNL